jgi:hypothetical protein
MVFSKKVIPVICIFFIGLAGCGSDKNKPVENKQTGTFQKDSLDAKVSIEIASKEFQTASASDPKEYVVIVYRLMNNTNKTIKGLDADVQINDESGNEIKKVKIMEAEQMVPGADKQYKALYSYNAFSDKDVKLKSIDLKNIKFDSKVLTIIYEDGTIDGKKP